MAKRKAKELEVEVATDVAELEAVAAAEAAIANTTDGGDDAVEAQALADAQAAVDTAPTAEVGDNLSVTEFGQVSNEMARGYLAAKGEEVKFEEPEDVKSDYYMNPIN